MFWLSDVLMCNVCMCSRVCVSEREEIDMRGDRNERREVERQYTHVYVCHGMCFRLWRAVINVVATSERYFKTPSQLRLVSWSRGTPHETREVIGVRRVDKCQGVAWREFGELGLSLYPFLPANCRLTFVLTGWDLLLAGWDLLGCHMG